MKKFFKLKKLISNSLKIHKSFARHNIWYGGLTDNSGAGVPPRSKTRAIDPGPGQGSQPGRAARRMHMGRQPGRHSHGQPARQVSAGARHWQGVAIYRKASAGPGPAMVAMADQHKRTRFGTSKNALFTNFGPNSDFKYLPLHYKPKQRNNMGRHWGCNGSIFKLFFKHSNF